MSKIDYRNYDPVKLKQLFFHYLKAREYTEDLDHHHMLKYALKDTHPDDIEVRMSAALYFGMVYNGLQSHIYHKLYPNIREINISQAEEWHSKNWQKTIYGVDVRYNKGHWVGQVDSIQKDFLEDNTKTFEQVLDEIIDFSDSPDNNLKRLFNRVQRVYKYGRMTTWLACQAMYDLVTYKGKKLPIQIRDIFLADPRKEDNMRTIWRGLCWTMNQKELLIEKHSGAGANEVTDDDIEWGRCALMELLDEASEDHLGYNLCAFRRESIMCQWGRLWCYKEGSKEYIGHSNCEAVRRFLMIRERFPEVDHSLIRESLRNNGVKHLGRPSRISGMCDKYPYDKDHPYYESNLDKRYYTKHLDQVFSDYQDTKSPDHINFGGIMLNLDEVVPGYVNGWKEIGLDPNKYLVREIWEDDGLPVPVLE